MKTIATIIYLPISLCIATLCFLCAIPLNKSFDDKDAISAFRRMERESKNLWPIKVWRNIPTWRRVVVAIVIYYLLF